MPELPEVETVVRDLRPLIVGETIRGIRLGQQKLRRPWKPAWSKKIEQSRIQAVHRRGKWILVELSSGELVVHLGMTGQFTVAGPEETTPDHLHITFLLASGCELRFRDVRRFGSIEWFPDAKAVAEFLGERLGPEPFGASREDFARAVLAANRPLKAILLDQTVLAGVGNIYADEALHRASLHPQTRGKSLTRQDCDRLLACVEAVLEKAIAGRGSTIRDYIGGSGLRGEYQDEFAVYGRTGEPCPTCQTRIERMRIGGRSSHFCPRCQPGDSMT